MSFLSNVSTIAINYINGICGAGKTYAIAAWADRAAKMGLKIILIQPTTQLVQETIRTTFPAMGVAMANVTAITSASHPYQVIKTITNHLETADPAKGEILVITHSAFFALPTYLFYGKNWMLVVDEIPPVERSFGLNIPDTHELLTRHLEITDDTHPEYWSIAAKDVSAIRKIAFNKRGDEVYEKFREFADSVVSPHWSVYVNAQNYERLTTETDVKGVARKLVGHAFMAPSVFAPFKAVYIAGACFEESLLFILWSNLTTPNLHVGFKDVSNSFDLYRRSHDNGDLLDIYYGVDQPWSKSVRDKVVECVDGTTGSVLDAITEKAKEMVGSKLIAEFKNTDIKKPFFENCERLPNMAHGLNVYQHIDHAFLMSALNPPTPHFAFLKRYADVEPEVVQTAMFRQAMYQAANRTSIRDPKNLNPKMWFVPDSQTAYWLQSMYPGSRVHGLDLFKGPLSKTNGKAGRPKVHPNATARKQAQRAREKHIKDTIFERLTRLDVVNGLEYRNKNRTHIRTDEIIACMTEPKNIGLTTLDRTAFQGTFFANKFSKEGVPFEGSFDDLVALYRDFSEQESESKEGLSAYSPSMYVANNGAETSRGYHNIAYVRNIILDFDGGDLTPEAFSALFPSWRMVFHSSWSHTEDKPKWRVIIPTEHLIDIENYKVITGYIMERLSMAGWWTEKELHDKPSRQDPTKFSGIHGFDVTKLNPACVLFVPAKRPDSFFFEAPGKALNLYELLEDIPVPALVQQPVAAQIVQPKAVVVNPNAAPALKKIQEALAAEYQKGAAARQCERVQKALDGWAAVAMMPHVGNSEFFNLGARLRAAGLSETEIEQHLLAEASKARHPRECRAEIKKILHSLRKPA
ncbi:hypothetical protein [Microvirga yunnanensis]|uniref:hypothetical protein n=1 Tax=Microvirga yunnanensis TaxID=2953740 RepID=UPI0021C5E736|nr:hypothetical protein [Microvirga sp. HBU65207]